MQTHLDTAESTNSTCGAAYPFKTTKIFCDLTRPRNQIRELLVSLMLDNAQGR